MYCYNFGFQFEGIDKCAHYCEIEVKFNARYSTKGKNMETEAICHSVRTEFE